MALVKGVSAGFLLAGQSPSADPDGDSTATVMDTLAHAFKDTAPTGATKVTEIGWYDGTAGTEEANYEVAIYAHNAGDDNPEAIIGSDVTNAKGTGAGWHKVTGLNISITAGTIYWMAVQLDDTATQTFIDQTTDAGEKVDFKVGQTALTDPWGTSSGTSGTIRAIYAVTDATEAAGGQDGPYVY